MTKTSQTPAATQAPTSTKTPIAGPADGPGVEEEIGYQEFVEDFAKDAFEALDGLSDDGGVETPTGSVGEDAAAVESGSPTITQDTGAVAPVVQTQEAQPAVVAPPEQKAPDATVLAGQQPAAVQPQAAPQEAAQPVAQASTQETTGAAVGGTEFISKIREELNKSRDKFEEALATTVYAMSEEEASEVLTNPQVVLPRVAARAHMEVTQNVLGTLAQILPVVIHGVNEATKQNSALTDQFFSRWPELDKGKDYQEVMNLARTFRAQYPQASAQEMIEHVGAMAVVKLGRLPAANGQQLAAVAAPSATPIYRPAASVPSAVQPAAPSNPWAEMSEYLDE